jgi:glycosyltransferase involved in cell wall biosynthesis
MMNDTFWRSGGVPIVIKRVSQALTDVDYCVAACKYDGRPEDLSWVPIGRFERFDLTSSNNPIRLARELRRFRKWFKHQRCDLVHCHHRKISVLLKLAGIPVLYTGHLAFRPVAWFRWLHPLRMTAVSASVATNIWENTGRKVLACIGVPVEFPPMPPPIDVRMVQRRAICIARFEAVKGHTHLLTAWKLLRDRGLRYELDLVGEGSLRLQLEAQVKKDGLDESVRFCGFTTDVASFTCNALFGILVSEVEGKPLAAMEAAAMGRPTLLTAVPGSIDVLPPEGKLRNGLKFGDPNELADALEEWFAHPQAVVEEGIRFFDFLSESHAPHKIASEYKNIYKQIIPELIS